MELYGEADGLLSAKFASISCDDAGVLNVTTGTKIKTSGVIRETSLTIHPDGRVEGYKQHLDDKVLVRLPYSTEKTLVYSVFHKIYERLAEYDGEKNLGGIMDPQNVGQLVNISHSLEFTGLPRAITNDAYDTWTQFIAQDGTQASSGKNTSNSR